MESEKPASGVNKPSGIPRASKLPVLSSKASRASLQENLEPAKAPISIARLQKRPSLSTFSRPGQPASKLQPVNGNQSFRKDNLSNGSKHASKPSNSSLSSHLSGSGSTAEAKERTIPSQTANPANTEGHENHSDLVSSSSSIVAPNQGQFVELSTNTLRSRDVDDLPKSPGKARPSRPSLSDRTMESIQMLPSTPKERRRSSFFSPVPSPMAPPPLPDSTLSRNGSNANGRPTTREGALPKSSGMPSSIVKRAPASVKSTIKTSSGGLSSTSSNPHRRSVSASLNSRLQGVSHSSKHAIPSASSQTAVERATLATPTSKTLSARPSKSRAPLSDVFVPAVKGSSTKTGHTSQAHKSIESEDSSKRAASTTPSKNSSAALREQIAAAKAAARKERAKHDSPQSVSGSYDGHFEVDQHADPFNLAPRDNKHVLRNRINAARMDGKLNIAALGLKEVPDEVLKMYDAATMEDSQVNWAEVVDLTRFIVADNEIEEIGDAVFPDKPSEDYDMDDQAEGNQFGGLEMVDLHSNALRALPMGLRRLERLTSLNLAHNKLDNSNFEVVTQIRSVKDLRLGYNELSGTLPASVAELKHLERLDLQSNKLLGLPEALRELAALKVLNFASNQLTSVPMASLQDIPLAELDVSGNALIASLFPAGCESRHSTLQVLNASNNSLAAITFNDALELPQLHTLDVTNNRVTALPPASGYPGLITLLAADNKIAELPVGFESLRKIRNVNLSSNELRLLDPRIAHMDSLESLVVGSNPLRDKKFLTMNAADIKRDLKARLAPLDTNDTASLEPDTTSNTEQVEMATISSPSASWSMKTNATLDLAGRRYTDSINDSLGSFFRSNEVKHLLLQWNTLTAFPPALWLGHDLRTLDLSHNGFSTDYIYDELELPSLQELNLSNCGLQTLDPLLSQIGAPNLQTLKISANRLSGVLPEFRATYPRLTTLTSNDNRFDSITADSLSGLHVVNLANNNIEQLPPDVGLLWNKGLRSLEIGGNAFRMPNYRILEKGTEATMKWLRDRLPESHGDADANSHAEPVMVGVS